MGVLDLLAGYSEAPTDCESLRGQARPQNDSVGTNFKAGVNVPGLILQFASGTGIEGRLGQAILPH
ncbi:hypothetical protein DVG80_18730 [Rhodococcus erythropolis]|nr:hypothetical protein DVG80_18730 [Rhodococcus erythropolis]